MLWSGSKLCILGRKHWCGSTSILGIINQHHDASLSVWLHWSAGTSLMPLPCQMWQIGLLAQSSSRSLAHLPRNSCNFFLSPLSCGRVSATYHRVHFRKCATKLSRICCVHWPCRTILQFPVVVSSCSAAAIVLLLFTSLFLHQWPCLLSLAVALTMSLWPEWISSRFDFQ